MTRKYACAFLLSAAVSLYGSQGIAVEDTLASTVAKMPVVVELFTSEGCASCPRAEEALSILAQKNAVPGVEIIPLEEHVDYWNDLGWKDKFSQEILSMRQWRYATVLGTKQVYTPQLIVQGRHQLVGSDKNGAFETIRNAARDPKYGIKIEQSPGKKPSETDFHISLQRLADKAPEDADVFFIVKEDNLSAKPNFGENAGAVLQHTAVVRYFKWVCKTGKEADANATHTVSLHKAWKQKDLSAVVLVQDANTREIIGAASIHL